MLKAKFDKQRNCLIYTGNKIEYSNRSSFFILVGFWCLMMVVVVYAYTGNLVSALVVPKLEPIVNSLEELVSRGLEITVQTTTPLAFSFLVSFGCMFCRRNINTNPSIYFNRMPHQAQTRNLGTDCEKIRAFLLQQPEREWLMFYSVNQNVPLLRFVNHIHNLLEANYCK